MGANNIEIPWNKENYFEVHTYQVSCPSYSPLLNISGCQSVLKYLSIYHKLPNYILPNLVVAWLYYNYFLCFQLCKGELNCRKLHILHPVWFELFLPTLVELDISGNYLTELPDCVPWKLQNLRVFRAASNTLKHLSTPDLTYTNDELCPR